MPKSVDSPVSSRDAILLRGDIATGYRISYLANFFTGPVYETLQQRFGIARSEFVVVYCLHHLGVLTAQDICEITGRPKNSISQAIHKLTAAGRLERRHDAADARRVLLRLTAGGRRLYEEAIPVFVRQEVAMLSALTEAERRQLDALLVKLTVRPDTWARGGR